MGLFGGMKYIMIYIFCEECGSNGQRWQNCYYWLFVSFATKVVHYDNCQGMSVIGSISNSRSKSYNRQLYAVFLYKVMMSFICGIVFLLYFMLNPESAIGIKHIFYLR